MRTKTYTFLTAFLASLLVLGTMALSACKTVTPDQLTKLQSITRGIVETAVTAELVAAPKQRPYIEGSLKAVDATIAQGAVTATVLIKLIDGLPVSPSAMRTAKGLALVYDAASAFWLNPASASAMLATARGISDGLRNALDATDLLAPTKFQISKEVLRAKTPRNIPAPTADNIKTIRTSNDLPK